MMKLNSLYFLFFTYIFSISIVAYLIKYYLLQQPRLDKLKLLINEQERVIKSQGQAIHHLYDNIFELETLCEHLIKELENECC
jgi:hypothetical protein